MKYGKFLGGLALGLELLAAPALRAAEPPASPEAVAAYNEGMRQLEALSSRKDFKIGDMRPLAPVEALFRKAIAADLPHGYYGMACLLYTVAAPSPNSFYEAWELALYAARRNVIEADALIISVIYAGVPGENTFNDMRLADLMLKQAYDRAETPNFVTGAPGTVPISTPIEARRLVDKVLGSGACGSQHLKGLTWEMTLPSEDALEKAWKRSKKAKLSSANPEAVRFYEQGMVIIGRPPAYVDFATAERLFRQAAELGLPHAHYGNACMIAAKQDASHIPEMLSELKLAADGGVLEAKAFQTWLARRGFGFTPDQFNDLWDEAVALALTPGLPSGAPGTVDLGSPDAVLGLVWDIASSGRCGRDMYPRFKQPTSPAEYLRARAAPP